jgi:S-formylglutathione hydrolase FrmB
MCRLHRVVLALAAVLAAAALLAPARAPAAPALGPDQLELVRSEQLSERLFELTFRTPALDGETGVRILLPQGYDAAAAPRYPVLYLLHGCCDDFRAWTEDGDAERITAGESLIVVMPDSGTGGGYTDWYNHGAGGPPMWETYHLSQLVPWIDGHFRTAADRGARAIAGLSMGGYGTMHYAARRPDLFVAAASFSGAVDSNSLFIQPLTGSEGLSRGRLPGAVFGPRATEEVRWRGHNPWDLAENLDGLDLTIRTGNGQPGGPGGDSGDPVETEVHAESESLHRRLAELGIPHVWDDYGPGGHDWYYWKRDLELLMPDLARVFTDPPAPPPEFTYRSIEPAYRAYEWRVEIDRPSLEFSELRARGRDGFALLGSGTGSVTTPPLYAPGSELAVELVRGAGGERRIVRAGDDCRLRVEVPLGPGNRDQQYSPQARASGTAIYTTRVRIAAGTAPACPLSGGGA